MFLLSMFSVLFHVLFCTKDLFCCGCLSGVLCVIFVIVSQCFASLTYDKMSNLNNKILTYTVFILGEIKYNLGSQLEVEFEYIRTSLLLLTSSNSLDSVQAGQGMLSKLNYAGMPLSSPAVSTALLRFEREFFFRFFFISVFQLRTDHHQHWCFWWLDLYVHF